MESFVQIAATDHSGNFAASVVASRGESRGAVVMIQEIFGVNDALLEQAAWVASMGFTAICPDLFWRQQPGVNISDKSEAEWKQAFALMNGFDHEKGMEDLRATLAAARALPGCNGKVATMGFCLGGRLAFRMAVESDADLNISYYGVGLDALVDGLDRITKPLICHIADRDQFFPAEGRARLDQAAAGHAQIALYHYEAEHAFARPGGIHYQALSAAIANGRSAEALDRYL